MEPIQSKPTGYSSVSPYLMVSNTRRLIDFLKQVFGATDLRHIVLPDGSTMHGEVRIDDSVIMLADAGPEASAFPVWLHVYVPDVDDTYRRALAAGGVSVQEPQQKEGQNDRRCGVKDPEGNIWWIATPVPNPNNQPSESWAEVKQLYRELLNSWNERSPTRFAGLFAEDGNTVGFDGSQMNGRAEISAELERIFADHQTAKYVGKVREVRLLAPGVAVLRAVVGMVPPGQTELNPAANAVQTLVAVRDVGGWQIAVFQNTPAAYHGRPDLAEQLTKELRELL